MPQPKNLLCDPNNSLNRSEWIKRTHLWNTVSVFASIALLTGACTQKSNGSNPTQTGATEAAPQVQTPAGPEWRVTWLSQCADAEIPCLASFGFQVDSSGQWQVGPATNGQTYQGELSISERQTLAEVFKSLRDDTSTQEPSSVPCANPELAESWLTVGGIQSAQINLQFFGKKQDIERNQTGFCGSLPTSQAEKLTQQLSTLLTQYHPSTFPDECLNRAQEVEAAYDSLRSCEKDQDCSWLDSTFHPIGEEELQFVMTDACTKLRPLVAANTVRVTESIIESLQSARAQLVETCGSSIARVDCEGIMGFESTLIRPVCDLGKCKLPSIEETQTRYRVRSPLKTVRR